MAERSPLKRKNADKFIDSLKATAIANIPDQATRRQNKIMCLLRRPEQQINRV